MISINILDKKPIITDSKTGEKKIDLTYPVVSGNTPISIVDYYNVPEIYEMRPDLIAYKNYGKEGNMDLILKINGISNPYSVKSGDSLYLFSSADFIKLLESNAIPLANKNAPKTYAKEIQEKISKISPERVDYLNARNISDVARGTPNLLGQGQKSSKVIDGKLVFGPDIGQCRGTNKKPLSEAQLKARLIEKKIFKGI